MSALVQAGTLFTSLRKLVAHNTQTQPRIGTRTLSFSLQLVR